MNSSELRKTIIFLMVIIIAIMMKMECRRKIDLLYPSIYSDKTPSEMSMINFALSTDF